MKLLTLNTHSLVEEDYERKLEYFIDWISKNEYDIIALQEVNQSIVEEAVIDTKFSNYVRANKNIVIKKDNHLFRVMSDKRVLKKGYHWVWTPIKIGYDKYDEGVGIMSRYPIKEVKEFYLTSSKSYTNWKVRKTIGIRVEIEGRDRWFFSVHFGWWNDVEESFKEQLVRMEKELFKLEEEIYLLGDFNNPAEIKGEGYDLLLQSGWYDTFELAKKKDSGVTVVGVIDGWKEHKNLKDMRIDFIFKSRKSDIKTSEVVFNGKNGEIISDHFGVEITE